MNAAREDKQKHLEIKSSKERKSAMSWILANPHAFPPLEVGKLKQETPPEASGPPEPVSHQEKSDYTNQEHGSHRGDKRQL